MSKTIECTIICTTQAKPEEFIGTERQLLNRMWEISDVTQNEKYAFNKTDNLLRIVFPNADITCYALIKQKPKWIDIKTERPKKPGQYWVHLYNGEILLDEFNANFNIFMHYHMSITHWMPANIPEPPVV